MKSSISNNDGVDIPTLVETRFREFVKAVPKGKPLSILNGHGACHLGLITYIYWGEMPYEECAALLNQIDDIEADRNHLGILVEMGRRVERWSSMEVTTTQNPKPGKLYVAHIQVLPEVMRRDFYDVECDLYSSITQDLKEGETTMGLVCLYSVETGFMIFSHHAASLTMNEIESCIFYRAEVE